MLSDWRTGNEYSTDMLDTGMIHVLNGTNQDDGCFHHTTENGAQLKIYQLFISGIFNLIISNHSWTWITETTKSETVKMRDYCALLHLWHKDNGTLGPECLSWQFVRVDTLKQSICPYAHHEYVKVGHLFTKFNIFQWSLA